MCSVICWWKYLKRPVALGEYILSSSSVAGFDFVEVEILLVSALVVGAAVSVDETGASLSLTVLPHLI